MKVMFCGAHPDDAEIYMFGTLLAYRKAGHDVGLVMACSGNGGTSARSAHQPLTVTRREEAEKGAAVLGARLTALDFPDMSLGENRMRLAARLQHLFSQEQPDIVFTHSPTDYHADHRVLSAVVTLAAAESRPVVYTDTLKGADFQPSHFVDIADHLDQKLKAIHLHHSQKPRRYMLAARTLAEQRGQEATGRADARMEAFRFDARTGQRDISRLLPGKAISGRIVTMIGLGGQQHASTTLRIAPGATPNMVRPRPEG